jgi:competence protein ComEA
MKLFNLKSLIAASTLSLALLGSAYAAEKVNINTADAATLDRVLVNVGPSKAEAIVAYRKAHGAFRSAEQLAQVDGIGLKTVEKNREMILIGGGCEDSGCRCRAEEALMQSPPELEVFALPSPRLRGEGARRAGEGEAPLHSRCSSRSHACPLACS